MASSFHSSPLSNPQPEQAMSEKQKIIKSITKADISKDDWTFEIIRDCKDRHVAGYLKCEIRHLDNSIRSDEEQYREELLHICRTVEWEHP